MSNTVPKEFVMKFKSASTTEYTLHKAAHHFFVTWFVHGAEYNLPYHSDTVYNFIKQGTWIQIPNTIEDMEVGDYVEDILELNESPYWTTGKLYDIKGITLLASAPLVLQDDSGNIRPRANLGFKFHKKAYIELFMKDKISTEVQLTKEKEMTKFKNMKFRVESPQHSELIQKELFKLGYEWDIAGSKQEVKNFCESFLFAYDSGEIAYSVINSTFESSTFKEYKLVPKYEIVEVDFIEVEGYKIERSKLVDFLKLQQGE